MYHQHMSEEAVRKAEQFTVLRVKMLIRVLKLTLIELHQCEIPQY